MNHSESETNEELVYKIQHNIDAYENTKKLIERNHGLVCEIVKKTFPSDTAKEDIEDLIQEGNIGLMMAAKRFDEQMECKFSTFAWSYVKGYMIRYSDKCFHTVSMSIDRVGKIRKYKRFVAKFRVENGRSPSDQEAASELEWKLNWVERIRNTMQSLECVSIDKPVGDDLTVGDSLFSSDNVEDAASKPLMLMELKTVLKKAISEIPERDAQIIRAKYFSGMKISNISEWIGCSRQAVCERVEKALALMKDGRYSEELLSFLPEGCRDNRQEKEEVELENNEFLL